MSYPPVAMICKNCGRKFDGNFCPACGQPATVGGRLTMRTFAKSMGMSYARLTPGFPATLRGLLCHPWSVISDYINGRRIKYSPPVTMLIQVILLASVILIFLRGITGLDIHPVSSGFLTIEGIMSFSNKSYLLGKSTKQLCISLMASNTS